MTQLLAASTLLGAMTLAAAAKSGRLGDGERRVLVVCNNAAVPEVATPFDRGPAFAALAGHFDQVVSWNDVLGPLHPAGWSPRADDALVLEPLLRRAWGLDAAPTELVLESIWVRPALAIAAVFASAPITVYAEGLMSYGPTRSPLPRQVQERVTRLLHLDVVPGVRPLLLREHGVPAEPLPDEAFAAVLADVDAALPDVPLPPVGTPMLLGQYLAALGVLSDAEEQDLHVAMLAGLAARGHRAVAYKPHPAAPAALGRRLDAAAEAHGVALHRLPAGLPAESLFARLRPAEVTGCFSTALVTARRWYGLPVSRVGTRLVLERLRPYQNSNRVPLVLVDATLPALDDAAEQPLPPSQLPDLLETVGYCMQPRTLAASRPVAQRFLAAHLDGRTRRYVRGRRLAALALPGAPPPHPVHRRVRRRVVALARRAGATLHAARDRVRDAPGGAR